MDTSIILAIFGLACALAVYAMVDRIVDGPERYFLAAVILSCTAYASVFVAIGMILRSAGF